MKFFLEGKIDFTLKERLYKCLNEMQKREENFTLQISHFIEENYKFKKLFSTHNHPMEKNFSEYLRKTVIPPLITEGHWKKINISYN